MTDVKLTFSMELTLSRFQDIFTHSWFWWRYKVLSRVGTRRERKGLGQSVLIVRATHPAGLTGTQP